MAQRWLQNHHDPTPGSTGRDVAVVWLTAIGFTVTRYIEPALTGMYTDGYLIGDRSASVVLGERSDLGLDDWTPGDPAASATMVDVTPGGLRVLLGTTSSVAAGISATYVRKAASVLSGTGDEGEDQLDADLSDALDDDATARMIAVTEISRAISAAALARYIMAGNITQYQWVASSGACPRCLENEAAGPLPLGQSFPNGDVPVHPNCRCAIVPA